MKKSKLLGLVALASLGLNANAQVEPTDGGIYYLYNTESGQFLTRGNNWGTRGVTRPVGMPWKVSISDGAYTLRMYDIVMSGGNNGLGDNSFSDNGTPIAFTSSGDANGFTLAYGDGYLEAPATAGDINVKGSKSTWQFLTQTQYDAKLAAIASAQEAAVAQAAGITLASGQTLADAIKDYAATQTSLGIARKADWSYAGVPSRGASVGDMDGSVEIYQGGGTLSKTVSGLKPGIYKVIAKGFKRVTSNAVCYNMGQAGYSVSDAFLTINGNIVPMASWYSACVNNGNPNSPTEGKNIWNNSDGYKSSGFAYVGSDGNLEIKVTSESYWGSSWFLFGGVDYVYYSDAVSDEMVNDLIATIPSGKVYSAYRQELDDAKAALEANPNLTNYNRLGKAVETAEANVSQYQNLAEAISTFGAYTAVSPDAKSALSAAIQTAQGVYDNASVENTSATIAALEAAVNNANVTDYSYVKATYPDAVVLGDWTTNTFGTASGQGYMDNSQRYYDKWNASAFNLNLAQDIELPAGEYVLYGIGRGQVELSNVELFVSYGQTENVVPFRMKGDLGFGVDVNGVANFSADATYNNAPNGRGWEYRYIAFELAEPTTITVGARGSVGTNGASWAGVFAPVLVGKPNLSLALNNLNNAIVEAEKVNTDAKQNAAVKQTFTQALATANTAKSSTDKTTIDNATAALESATNAANSSIAVYEQIAVLNAKAATLDAVGQASYASTLAAYNDGTLTTVAEAETAYAEAYAAYNEAAYKAVTSKGTDMTSAIVNPSFETGDLTGWVCNNGSDTGSKDNSNGTYTMAGCDGAKLFNTWNGGTCASVTQTITGLKAGKYAVVATMASDAAHELYVSLNGGTQGTATTTDKGTGVVVSAEGEIALGSNELTIEAGTIDGGWFKADNFKLVLLEEYAEPVIADFKATDGQAITSINGDFGDTEFDITYVREFKAANKWQSLYLPFSVSLENNDADVVLAKIDDVIEDNGELVIKIIKVSKYETVVARRPLFIAAKTVGVKNIKTGVSTIDEPLDGGYDYSAAEFIGVLSKASAGQAGRYVMSGGELCLVPQSMNNLTLGVNRWAMYVNDGSSVRIRINAEGFSADEATAIASAVAESVENGEIFSINGAKVKDAKSGLYIKGGKKVYVK